MFRPDAASRSRLQEFIDHFAVSKADIIRQMLAQATPEEFPPSWYRRPP
jgi:hypothetical protein